MGLHHGWSRDDFREAAKIVDPKGRPFANVCIGCDRYFEQTLGPMIARRRAARIDGVGARGNDE